MIKYGTNKQIHKIGIQLFITKKPTEIGKTGVGTTMLHITNCNRCTWTYSGEIMTNITWSASELFWSRKYYTQSKGIASIGPLEWRRTRKFKIGGCMRRKSSLSLPIGCCVLGFSNVNIWSLSPSDSRDHSTHDTNESNHLKGHKVLAQCCLLIHCGDNGAWRLLMTQFVLCTR